MHTHPNSPTARRSAVAIALTVTLVGAATALALALSMVQPARARSDTGGDSSGTVRPSPIVSRQQSQPATTAERLRAEPARPVDEAPTDRPKGGGELLPPPRYVLSGPSGSRFADVPGAERPCIVFEPPTGGLKIICPQRGEGGAR